MLFIGSPCALTAQETPPRTTTPPQFVSVAYIVPKSVRQGRSQDSVNAGAQLGAVTRAYIGRI